MNRQKIMTSIGLSIRPGGCWRVAGWAGLVAPWSQLMGETIHPDTPMTPAGTLGVIENVRPWLADRVNWQDATYKMQVWFVYTWKPQSFQINLNRHWRGNNEIDSDEDGNCKWHRARLLSDSKGHLILTVMQKRRRIYWITWFNGSLFLGFTLRNSCQLIYVEGKSTRQSRSVICFAMIIFLYVHIVYVNMNK